MVTPKKRKNKDGSCVYTALVYDYTDADGKRKYKRITAPSMAEWYRLEEEFQAERLLSEEERREKHKRGLTVGEALDKYIERQKTLLSPTTIHGYESIRRFRFVTLMDKYVADLDDETMQQAIVDESRVITAQGKRIAPKTVNGAYSLIASALKAECKATFQVRLLSRQQHVIEIPDAADIIPLIKGSSIELPCMLALWLSFSLSEVRGLMCSSVKPDGRIVIEQVRVLVDGVDIVKPSAKVGTRLRAHALPEYIMRLIEQQETYRHYKKTGEDDFLIPLSVNQIRGRLDTLMEHGGIEGMSFHKLRHMSASVMALLNIPTLYAQERGGWKTEHTMKRIYQHTFTKGRMAADEKVNEYFDKLLGD